MNAVVLIQTYNQRPLHDVSYNAYRWRPQANANVTMFAVAGSRGAVLNVMILMYLIGAQSTQLLHATVRITIAVVLM